MRVWSPLLVLSLLVVLIPAVPADPVPPSSDPPTSGHGVGTAQVCFGVYPVGTFLCWTEVMTFGFQRTGDDLDVRASGPAPGTSGASCSSSLDRYGEEVHEGSIHTLIVPSVPCTGAHASASWTDPPVADLCELSVYAQGSDLFYASIAASGIGTCA